MHPHEAAYAEFAAFMGMDPASREPIAFNPTDPRFLEGYFRFLHHPHEALGVDFWWIDWQQGKKTPFGNVDPLWKHSSYGARFNPTSTGPPMKMPRAGSR